MIAVTKHAIDRFKQRANIEKTDNEIKEYLIGCVISKAILLNYLDGHYPIYIDKLYAVIKNRTIVTVTKCNVLCESKPVPKTVRKFKAKSKVKKANK